MKWDKHILRSKLEPNFEFQEVVEFSPEVFKSFSRLRKLEKVDVSGKCFFDKVLEVLYVELRVVGEMIVPCAITLEDIKHEFFAETEEVFAFEEGISSDAYVVEGEEIDLLPTIMQLILSEVPLKLVKKGLKEYPKGQDWEIVSETSATKSDEIDPRLAKLLEYKTFEE